jgi:hypothetical protein
LIQIKDECAIFGNEIFDELRIASKGGIADYSGITYEKIQNQYGVFWPCPSDEHPSLSSGLPGSDPR